MIETATQLRAWIDGHADRHHPAGERCSCGWAQIGPDWPPLDEHIEHVAVAELADELASNWGDVKNGPLSWSEVETMLDGWLERRTAVSDFYEEAVSIIASGDPTDPVAFANDVLAYGEGCEAEVGRVDHTDVEDDVGYQ